MAVSPCISSQLSSRSSSSFLCEWGQHTGLLSAPQTSKLSHLCLLHSFSPDLEVITKSCLNAPSPGFFLNQVPHCYLSWFTVPLHCRYQFCNRVCMHVCVHVCTASTSLWSLGSRTMFSFLPAESQERLLNILYAHHQLCWVNESTGTENPFSHFTSKHIQWWNGKIHNCDERSMGWSSNK